MFCWRFAFLPIQNFTPWPHFLLYLNLSTWRLKPRFQAAWHTLKKIICCKYFTLFFNQHNYLWITYPRFDRLPNSDPSSSKRIFPSVSLLVGPESRAAISISSRQDMMKLIQTSSVWRRYYRLWAWPLKKCSKNLLWDKLNSGHGISIY